MCIRFQRIRCRELLRYQDASSGGIEPAYLGWAASFVEEFVIVTIGLP